MHQPTSHHFISQRTRLHYVDYGNPNAPLLLLVHGGRDHCRSWDWTAEALRNDWHVVAVDLRGHGDSDWLADGSYDLPTFVYDLAQLVHHLEAATVTIVAHSLGGNIALRYAGLYPDRVRRLVSIEGLGPSPEMQEKTLSKPLADRWRTFIDDKRAAAARLPRRYGTFDEALARMLAQNPRLGEEQARHLTLHGVNRNEDGSWSWKFDNYLNVSNFFDIGYAEVERLWAAITCPVLLVYGTESWASNPERDGRARHFRDARVLEVEGAAHWVHHDRFDGFIAALRAFL